MYGDDERTARSQQTDTHSAHSAHSVNTSSGALDVPRMNGHQGMQYIRSVVIRSRAYAECYYTNARWYGRMFIFVNLLATVLSVLSSFFGLSFIEDPNQARIIAGCVSLLAGLVSGVSLTVNPGKRKKHNEEGGDKYRALFEELQSIPSGIPDRKLSKTIQKTVRTLIDLADAYDEPDHARLQRSEEHIRQRYSRFQIGGDLERGDLVASEL